LVTKFKSQNAKRISLPHLYPPPPCGRGGLRRGKKENIGERGETFSSISLLLVFLLKKGGN